MTVEQKKILMLLGSPRKNGNSTALAARLAQGAESAGAVVDSLYIHGMDIKPCQACWKCQSPDSKGCVIKDDMQQVFPKLIEADAWVIATPVHWFNMSAQTKLWMDRCFALARYGKHPFKKNAGIVITYGDSDPFKSGAVNAIRCFQDSFNYTGTTIAGVVYGSAMNPGDIEANTGVMEEAEKLGMKLAAM
ncbi:MAG: flavodoxin family protein [Spirochaetes bacterium]|nr:MAG: flavodoxin family protein [Spirochaetota bacterium]